LAQSGRARRLGECPLLGEIEAQRSGIALAKEKAAEIKYRGRKPSYARDQFSAVCDLLGRSAGIGEIATATGLSRQAIYRIKDDPAAAETALAC
jgi:putative DNA-invertase from lambdoid prophage Rac